MDIPMTSDCSSLNTGGHKDAEKLRLHLKKKLMGREFEGYETERASLLKSINRTIEFGESNSVLVLGTSGSGKTMMINSVLEEIKCTKIFDNLYIIVKLDGFYHNDNYSALMEISEQINVEVCLDENDSECNDTLPTKINYLLTNLASRNEENPKSVIFVLENCHSFSQELLYTLLDKARSNKVPVFVVGTTKVLDFIKRLEIRIESRFTGNIIRLRSDRTINERLEKFRELLSIRDQNLNLDHNYVECWNEKVSHLCSQNLVEDLFKRLFIESGPDNECRFTNFLFNSVSHVNEKDPYLRIEHLQQALEMVQVENKIELLKSLSTLELCIMISALHHSDIYEEPFNFEMIYQRFYKFAKNSKILLFTHRDLAYKAFDTLLKLDLIEEFKESKESKDHALYRLGVRSDEIREAVKTYPNLETEVSMWIFNNVMD